MKKKALLALVMVTVLAGMSVGAYALVKGGVLGSVNRKYNIFNMVDDSLGTMQEMNKTMDEVGSNVQVLNEKLDLLGETNGLLEQQLGVVDQLNGLMTSQKPLLTAANSSISTLKGKLLVTLSGVTSLEPIMAELLTAMDGSLQVTSQVVAGTSRMVGLASTISSLFDGTLSCLARIQPLSAKAKAYMNGDILARLDQFLPKTARLTGPAPTTSGIVRSPLPSTAQAPAAPQQAVEGPADLVDETLETVEEVTEQVPIVHEIVDPVLDILK